MDFSSLTVSNTNTLKSGGKSSGYSAKVPDFDQNKYLLSDQHFSFNI